MKGLQGKILVVTGGSGLIGRSIVGRLREEGAICINVDIQHPDEHELNWVYDLTDTADIDKLVQRVKTELGRIDGWVNNAYPRTKDWGAKVEDVPFASFQQNVDMQLNSVFYISQQVLEVMKQQNSGSLINVASIYGIVGNDFTVYEGTGGMTSPVGYAAIKGAIVNLTRYLASYFGSYGIRVNTVSPGGIFNGQNPVFVKNFETKVPLRRMGLPEDIAPSIAFLLSDDSKYITGHNLVVDGGWTAI